MAYKLDFMNMDMSNMSNTGALATVARSAEGWLGWGGQQLGRKDCRRQISFLYTEAVKVS